MFRQLLNGKQRLGLLNNKRTLKTLDFGGSKEVVYERADYPMQKIQKMFKNDVFSVIGYGTQVNHLNPH
jgi:hypothetical protein